MDNVAQKGYQLEYLPSSLKAKILHVMSKRHGMINSTTLPKVLLFNLSSRPDLCGRRSLVVQVSVEISGSSRKVGRIS